MLIALKSVIGISLTNCAEPLRYKTSRLLSAQSVHSSSPSPELSSGTALFTTEVITKLFSAF